MKQIDDVAQLFLGFRCLSDGLERDKVDNGGELVLDAVIQLVQEGLSSEGRTGDRLGIFGLLMDINYTV
jgi:hypothetical protein